MENERRIAGIYRAMTEGQEEAQATRAPGWGLGALLLGAFALAGCGGAADDAGFGSERITGMGNDAYGDDGWDDDYTDTGTSTHSRHDSGDSWSDSDHHSRHDSGDSWSDSGHHSRHDESCDSHHRS